MKRAAEDDPMEFVAVGMPGGDPDLMAECVIEEFLLMGWSDSQLLTLFKHPRFQATHQIYLERGEDYVRALISRVCTAWRPVAGGIQEGAGNA